MRMASFTPAVGGSVAMRCCISRAASQAASGLLNATISSSPIVLTTWPSRVVTISRSAPRQASMVFAAGLSPSSSYSAVLPLTSANRIARSLEMSVIAFGKVSPIFRGLPTAGGSTAEPFMNANIKVAERKCYINGEFKASARQFAKINPVDGTVVAQVHEADRAMVDAAVRAAKAALKGPWGRMAMQARVDLLRRIAEGIEKRFDDFLQAEVADTGKPVSLASHLDIPRGAANFRVFADIVRTYGTESYHLDTPDGKGAVNYAMRTLLAEVMHEAGVPAGVYNVVHGFGPDSAGEFITTHPGVNGITFTGETATGAAIMKAVAPTVKPISFELGGKNPAIIFADCDFEAAVTGMANAIFSNTGQVCLAPERVYVERPIFDKFVGALKAKAEALVLGFPQDKATNMGPLISKQQREKVLSYYELAKKEGAKVVTGGGVPKFGDARTPFGGAKLSGIGREGGLHSLNFYSEPTNVCIKL